MSNMHHAIARLIGAARFRHDKRARLFMVLPFVVASAAPTEARGEAPRNRRGSPSPAFVAGQPHAPLLAAALLAPCGRTDGDPAGAPGNHRKGLPSLVHSADGIAGSDLMPPGASIAAGPTYIIAAANSVIVVASKLGSPVRQAALASWFENVSPPGVPLEPRVAYDHHAGRWILVAVARDGERSSYLLSVSEGSDPTGAWWNWNLDASMDGNEPSQNRAGDPRIGFDDETIVSIASNQYSSAGDFQYAKVRVLEKQLLYANGGGPPLDWEDYWNWANEDGSPVFGWEPALVFGQPGAGYLANTTSPAAGSGVTLWRLTKQSGLEMIGTVPVARYATPPPAEQKGSVELVSTGDCRLSNAVFREGLLYTALTEARDWGNGSRATIRFLALNVATVKTALETSFGNLYFHYFYPAVAVDAAKNIVMVFSRSGAEEFISLRATGMTPIELSFGGNIVLHQGEGPIESVDGTGLVPWGTNGIALDSTGCASVWLHGPYAASDQTWRTILARVSYDTSVCFLRGECNSDGKRNIADAVYLLAYLFSPPNPLTCDDAADANDDGKLNIADAVTILSFLFGGSGPLPAPFDDCAPDPTTDGDALGCASYPACP
jgi:hypothetical protein